MSNLPNAGPIILTVPGITDVSIAGATAGPIVRYRWPRPYVLSAWWLSTRSGSPVDLAGLRLRIHDNENELVTDGNGTTVSTSGLSLMGRSPRWQPFRWDMRAGDVWLFQLFNTNVGAVVPWFGLRVET